MGFWCFGASGLGLTVFMRVSGALGWSFKSLAGSRVLGIGLQVSSGRVALVQASFACTDAGQQTFANHAGHPCAANSTSKGCVAYSNVFRNPAFTHTELQQLFLVGASDAR